ncbi:hypothetical protein D9756_007200 [Leucocoprinus leucothites]|uniref:Uncharacterized protein n=1 Tax=Leucocoprinus leucothites TaxID=201217 RepID=A0A8H5D6C6_9AGAR|nr:hypothetical protein D9756_007200 [Leucoagaricus leucothites]
MTEMPLDGRPQPTQISQNPSPLSTQERRKAQEKRKANLLGDDAAREAKRRHKNGDSLIPYSPFGEQCAFHDIYFMTANTNAVIPLPFFLHKNIRYVDIHFPTMNLKKTYAADGSKGAPILDIAALTKIFGEEGSISYSEFYIAGEQYIHFEGQRDKEQDGTWTQGWRQHFNFFKRAEAGDLYDFWKRTELSLRSDRITQNVAFDFSSYLLSLKMASFVREMELKLQESMTGPSTVRPPSSSRKPSSNKSVFKPFQSKPFPSGNNRVSTSAVCIVCAEPGHSHSVFGYTQSRDSGKLSCEEPHAVGRG